MSQQPVYLLDSDVLMQATRTYYAFDLAPGFWDALIEHLESGEVRSIDWVLEEIDRGQDDLTRWANESFRDAFLSTQNATTVQNYSIIADWVENNPRYTAAAKAAFANAADGWLVAHAQTIGGIVVTQEQPEPLARKIIKIPDLCIQFDVDWIGTYEMLRNLGVRIG